MLRRLVLSVLIVLIAVASLSAQAQQPELRTGIFRGMKVTYTWFPSKENNGTGKAVFQGDIILDHVDQLPSSGLSAGSLRRVNRRLTQFAQRRWFLCGDFSQTNNCGSSLAASSSCIVNVTFNPSSVGAITGALTFNDSAGTSPQLVKLTGTGEAPLTVSPTSLTLPSAAVGSSSSGTVTLTNIQTTTMTLSATASADYSVTGGSCGGSLAGGASCTITVTFTPQYKGTIKGALDITTNSAFSTLTIGLSGAATGGPTVPLKLSPTSLTFSSTGIGATSAAKTITVTNKGTGSITINSISASTNFTAVGSGSSPCGGTLAKSASCTLSVTFTPSDTGSVKGSVAIATTGPGSPQIAAVSGTGAVPVTLAPTSLTFSGQAVGTTSAPKTVTLTNSSGGTLTISSLVASGDYSATPSGGTPCGATVASGATCTFSVTFTPNVKGSISGAVTVSTSAPLSPAVIKLTGTGQ